MINKQNFQISIPALELTLLRQTYENIEKKQSSGIMIKTSFTTYTKIERNNK